MIGLPTLEIDLDMIIEILMMIGLIGAVKVLGPDDFDFFLAEEAYCLPVGEDELASDEEIIEALNAATETMTIHKTDVDGLTWNLDWLKTFQNNAHHLEGWLYNHVILMLFALKRFKDLLNETEYMILERAIFWSDLGKYHTTKAGKKLWEDGTPMSTAFGHDKKSAELLDEAMSILKTPYDWYTSVRWLVMEHMNAHKLEEMDENGKTTIPDFLKPAIEGLEVWNWPEWTDLDIPHGESMGKKDYAWKQRGNSQLLRIKQLCDSMGRISELDF